MSLVLGGDRKDNFLRKHSDSMRRFNTNELVANAQLDDEMESKEDIFQEIHQEGAYMKLDALKDEFVEI